MKRFHFRTALSSALMATSLSTFAMDATLVCRVKWKNETEPVTLSTSNHCMDSCQVQLAGPNGIYFQAETSSASRMKLSLNSLNSNETLILVKEFNVIENANHCVSTSIEKEGSSSSCMVCLE